MPFNTPLTEPVSIHLLSLQALMKLTDELSWQHLGDVEAHAPGPWVYVLTDGRTVWYPGKSDSRDGAGAKRAACYNGWVARYRAELAAIGRPDPFADAQHGALSLTTWSGIVRLAARYNLHALAASVAHTGLPGSVWEARVKALSGILTGGVESTSSGTVWERKPGTLRGDAYEWAENRIAELRK